MNMKYFVVDVFTDKPLSKRGGQLWCEDAGERVKIGGTAVLYMTGVINL